MALGKLYAGMAMAALQALRTEEGLSWSKRAMDLAERFADEELWTNAAVLHGLHLFWRGLPSKSLALIDRAYARADYSSNNRLAFVAPWSAASLRIALLDPCDAQRFLLNELSRPRAAQAPLQRRMLKNNLRSTYARSGDLARALSVTDESKELLHREIAVYRGDWETADRMNSKEMEEANRTGSRDGAVWAMAELGEVRRVSGEFAQAESLLKSSLDLCVAEKDSFLNVEIVVRTRFVMLYADMERAEAGPLHVARRREIIENGEDWRGGYR